MNEPNKSHPNYFPPTDKKLVAALKRASKAHAKAISLLREAFHLSREVEAPEGFRDMILRTIERTDRSTRDIQDLVTFDADQAAIVAEDAKRNAPKSYAEICEDMDERQQASLR